MRFEVVPVALNPDQVAALGLPSTPLKETERRADRWREALGIEQTEIDALATLRPDVLREIVERAFDPYVDRDLRNRVTLAEVAWREQAAAALQIDQEHLEALRAEAEGRLSELKDVIADINTRLRIAAADHFTLPAAVWWCASSCPPSYHGHLMGNCPLYDGRHHQSEALIRQ